MDKLTENIKKTRPNIKKSTIDSYIKSLKVLNGGEFKNIDFLNDYDNMMKKIKEFKPATQKAKLRNYLNAILRNKKKMSTGGVLKQPDNPGLKKLPTAVRNKMGFMKKGGNVGHTDYRKASKGMLLISVDMMKKKKKNK